MVKQYKLTFKNPHKFTILRYAVVNYRDRLTAMRDEFDYVDKKKRDEITNAIDFCSATIKKIDKILDIVEPVNANLSREIEV